MDVHLALSTLGLTVGYTEQELRSAYRKMSKKYHPDIAGDSGKEMFIRVKSAYECLSNPRVNIPKKLYTHGSIFKVVSV